jgi:hypothetical protein
MRNNAHNTFSQMQASIAQLGLVINGVGQAFNVLKQAFNFVVNPADQFEQLQIRLVNLYQDAEIANEVFGKFKEIAATTPFELTDVVNAGAQLKAFGLNAEETLKSVTDLAAFMGVNVVDASNAVGRAFAGGAGAADVLRERGVLELIKSFKGIEDLTKLTLPEFRKAMLETFQDSSAGIAGSTTRLSNSYTGAVSNMKDAFTNLKAELGNHILPLLKNGANFAGKFFRSLTETSLEKTIRELKELGAAAEDVWALEKFGMQQRLVDINSELDNANFNYERIESVTSRIKHLTEEQLKMTKFEAILKKENRYSDEQLFEIWQSLGFTYGEALSKVQDYNDSIKAGNYLTANDVVQKALDKRNDSLKKESKEILKHKELLIEREALEKKINNSRESKTGNIDANNITNSSIKDTSFDKELELLELKKSRNLDVNNAILHLYENHLSKLEVIHGENSLEYQKVLTKKYEFERKIELQKLQDKKKNSAELSQINKSVFELNNYLENQTDPELARYNRRKRNLEKFFDDKKLMIQEFNRLQRKKGLEEINFEKAKIKALNDLQSQYNRGKLRGAFDTFQKLANNMGKHGKLMFGIAKALNIAEVVMDTPKAAMSAYKSMVGIPVVGPTLATAAYAATIAQGGFTISEISKAKPPKYELGGQIEGKSHADGGVNIEAEGGEYIFSVKRVLLLGKKFLDFLNFAAVEKVQQFVNLLSQVSSGIPELNFPEIGSIPLPNLDFSNQSSNSNNTFSFDTNELVSSISDPIIKAIKDSQPIVIVKNGSLVEVHKQNMKAKDVYNRRLK